MVRWRRSWCFRTSSARRPGKPKSLHRTAAMTVVVTGAMAIAVMGMEVTVAMAIGAEAMAIGAEAVAVAGASALGGGAGGSVGECWGLVWQVALVFLHSSVHAGSRSHAQSRHALSQHLSIPV
mmetsp:Transcript_14764/g.37148  ORF Transcript_14764/g.37148 Transcript_14764/m.37148 type:complete len:123 (+) Transcript_14764:166-534(+)